MRQQKPEIEIKRLSEIEVSERQGVLLHIAQRGGTVPDYAVERMMKDYQVRSETNPENFHIAFDGDNPIGFSYSIRLDGIPTGQRMNHAHDRGSIAYLHEPTGQRVLH